jgi:hypothetical protein
MIRIGAARFGHRTPGLRPGGLADCQHLSTFGAVGGAEVTEESETLWIEAPEASGGPPVGTVPWAVKRIAETLHCSPEYATGLLTAAVRTHELRAYYEGRPVVSSGPWEAFDFDPARYDREVVEKRRLRRLSSLHIGRECIHPHAIAIHEVHLEQWLRWKGPSAVGRLESAAPTAGVTTPGAPTAVANGAAAPLERSGIVSRPSRRTRGRKAHYDWAPVEQMLGVWLAANGCPRLGDGLQADLESQVLGMFPEDECPSESTVRTRVARAISVHKRAHGG